MWFFYPIERLGGVGHRDLARLDAAYLRPVTSSGRCRRLTSPAWSGTG
jgi:hypothetical protein